MSGTWADAGLRVVWTDFPEVIDPALTLRENCIAYWKMDEANGTRIDATGNGRNLTSVGVSSALGKINDAALWNNNEQYLHSSDSVFNVVGTSFTFALWVYLTNKDFYRYFVSKEDSVSFADPYGMAYFPDYDPGNPDRLVFWVGDGIDYPTIKAEEIGSPILNTWYFVVGWYDASTPSINIQVNNGTVYTLSVSVSPSSNTDKFNIGAVLDVYNPHHGRLDEVGFWKRLLTSEERAYLYNSGNGRTLYP